MRFVLHFSAFVYPTITERRNFSVPFFFFLFFFSYEVMRTARPPVNNAGSVNNRIITSTDFYGPRLFAYDIIIYVHSLRPRS